MIIAATGHRPKFCPCQYDESHNWLTILKENLYHSLSDEPDIEYCISGMAIGFDIWFAEEVLGLKKSLHCYVPFKNQQKKWPKKTQLRYDVILGKADKIIYCSENYSNEAFFKRDCAMVDVADKIYSLLNPDIQSGGTHYTVSYALKNNKLVRNFWHEQV